MKRIKKILLTFLSAMIPIATISASLTETNTLEVNYINSQETKQLRDEIIIEFKEKITNFNENLVIKEFQKIKKRNIDFSSLILKETTVPYNNIIHLQIKNNNLNTIINYLNKYNSIIKKIDFLDYKNTLINNSRRIEPTLDDILYVPGTPKNEIEKHKILDSSNTRNNYEEKYATSNVFAEYKYKKRFLDTSKIINVGVLEVDGVIEDSDEVFPLREIYYKDVGKTSRHANMVASIIGGKYGVYENSKIFSASTEDHNFIQSWLERLSWLVRSGVKIINHSYSFLKTPKNKKEIDLFPKLDEYKYSFYSSTLDNLSLKGNIINVVAAGNGNNLPKEHYVNEITSIGMSYNSIIVGSLNDSKNSYLKPSNFSSYKTNSSYSYENLPKPLILAPGENFVYPDEKWHNKWLNLDKSKNGYASYSVSGTSFAAPIISGSIALFLSNQTRELKFYELISLLSLSGEIDKEKYKKDDLNKPLYKSDTGVGIFNYEKMVDAAKNTILTINSKDFHNDVWEYETEPNRWETRVNLSYASKKFSFLKSYHSPIVFSLFWSRKNGFNTNSYVYNNIDDFDLYLQYEENNEWVTVERSIVTNTNLEIIKFIPQKNVNYRLVIELNETNSSSNIDLENYLNNVLSISSLVSKDIHNIFHWEENYEIINLN
ncbi:S8 family serine peptidase [Mycoplasmopsis felis]|uniref:S8 family serine peptidase n=2 Tax=Mycoplasmopsis felis TaxID=33923 RepID=UPI002DD431B7|nr:S8 family serine peptidase [Mycoplasmopsis felis]WRX06909.1 S8 family serine peptidase [Mycoplasmopsis felis]